MYIINVFVSHSWSYSEDYDKIGEWLFGSTWSVGAEQLIFLDQSVPRTDPIHYAPNEETLRNAIYQRINSSDAVVIPTGVYATYSKWIGKEIEGAHLYAKPIIGVDGWGAQRGSTVVRDAASVVVGWTKKSVATAVWQETR